VWLALIGGEDGARGLGPRREFLVAGGAIRRAGEALDEAPAGRIVVSGAAWPRVAARYVADGTPGGNCALLAGRDAVPPGRDAWLAQGGPEAAAAAAAAAARHPGAGREVGGSPAREGEEEELWQRLRHCCPEGAQELRDVLGLAGEVRTMTVMFVKLHQAGLGDDAGPEALRGVHEALLLLQVRGGGGGEHEGTQTNASRHRGKTTDSGPI
jgi:hypothetical protein